MQKVPFWKIPLSSLKKEERQAGSCESYIDYQKLFSEREDSAILHLIPCKQVTVRTVVSLMEKRWTNSS